MAPKDKSNIATARTVDREIRNSVGSNLSPPGSGNSFKRCGVSAKPILGKFQLKRDQGEPCLLGISWDSGRHFGALFGAPGALLGVRRMWRQPVKIMKVHFFRFPTFCSAHRSPINFESDFVSDF